MNTDLEVIDPRSNDAPEQIDRACHTLGFFRIPGDVVDRQIADAAWADAHAFFALDDDKKHGVVFPEPGYPYGYSPFAFETLAASQGEVTAPDLKESFSVGPDCLGPIRTTTDAAEAWIRSPSLWPTEPATISSTWPAYFSAMSDVSARLLSIMATALDLPATYFEPMIDHHTSAMRSLRYPPLIGPTPAGSLRAGAHSDYGTLTILRTDEIPGLEVEGPDGSWIAVAPEPDTYVVNLGDSIAQWTNDRWRSTVHRVTTVSPAERFSMAFFHMANWDAMIECLPTCTTPANPPRHQPAQAGPWLMTKFQRTVS